MKIVKVTYTVNAQFVATNQENVRKFVKDIEALNNPAIRYISYLASDAKHSSILPLLTMMKHKSSFWTCLRLNHFSSNVMRANWKRRKIWRSLIL
jgi:hypothetical protein